MAWVYQEDLEEASSSVQACLPSGQGMDHPHREQGLTTERAGQKGKGGGKIEVEKGQKQRRIDWA